MEVKGYVLCCAEKQVSKVNKSIEIGDFLVNFETHDGNIPCL